MIKTHNAPWLCPLALLAALLAGCDRPVPPSAPPKPAAQPAVMAECLPCNGHKIEVTEKTAHVEHAGQTYYFCSNGCREAFAKEPAKFIAKASATQPSTQPAAAAALH